MKFSTFAWPAAYSVVDEAHELPLLLEGHVVKYPFVGGVSAMPSSPHETPGLFVLPKVWSRPSQCPISCVRFRAFSPPRNLLLNTTASCTEPMGQDPGLNV